MVLLELEIETWIFQMYVSDARTPLPSPYTNHKNVAQCV